MFTHTSFYNQQDIANEAREKGAKWIVVYTDHYRGNGKGYYQSVENFAKSKVFRWYDAPEDRGALKVYITDDDVPALVAERTELINKYNEIQFLRYPVDDISMMKVDHRMKLTNPIRVEAENHNAKMRSILAQRKSEWESKLASIREKLKHTKGISSTLIEIFI